uniref:Protein kinase domain-containing protein n=1 Tax=Schistocephalus solidus TaxID=70667 RepID=A0A0X3PXC3_SCHSO
MPPTPGVIWLLPTNSLRTIWNNTNSIRPTGIPTVFGPVMALLPTQTALSVFLSRWLGVGCVVATWIFSAVMVACGLLPIFLLVVIFYRRKLKEAENLTRKPYEDLCAELADINMPSTDIVLNRRVGQGAFGLVYGGEAKRLGRWEAVAVKVITNKTTYEGKMDFLSEAKLMRGLDHKNVVRLVGICLHQQENDIYLVMELMLLGDLKTYLLARRVLAQSDPDHEDIRPSTLTNMAIDIAEGMAYLHNKRLIHRDIACRNCLVGRDRVVKIGDFGLTREAKSNSPDGYYRFTRNCELPIRWMSPEAVQFGIFSVKSDLWSYGIVLYEMITFGVFPYEGLCDVEVVERVKRMEFSITDFLPIAAKDTPVWRLIDSCCQHHWQHRPESMNQVIEALRANKDCIRPFLTDEPPKPNTTINALPFQPGAGACIMSEAPVTQPLAASTGLSLGRVGANMPLLHAEHVQNLCRPWHGPGNFTDPVHVRSSSSSGGGSSNNGGGGGGAVYLHSGDTGPLCVGPSQRPSHSGSSMGVTIRQPIGSWTSARVAGRQSSYAFSNKLGPAVPPPPPHESRINSTPSSDKVASRIAINGGRDYGVGSFHQHPTPSVHLRSSADFVAVANEDLDLDGVRDFQTNVSEPTSPLSAKDAVFSAATADALEPGYQSWCSVPPPRSVVGDQQRYISTSPTVPPSATGRSELFTAGVSATANVAEESTALLTSTNRSLSAEFLHFNDLVDDFSKPLHDDDDSDRTPPTAAGRPLAATHHCTSCPLKSFLAVSTEAASPVTPTPATGTNAALLPFAPKSTSPTSTATASASSTNFFAMRVHQTRAEKARRMRRISNGAERALRRAVRVFTGGGTGSQGGGGVGGGTNWDQLDLEQPRSHWHRPTKVAVLASKAGFKYSGGSGGASSKERLSASGCNESALRHLQHNYCLEELSGRMNDTCKSLPQVSAGCQSNCKLAANACRPTFGSAGDAHHLIKASLTSPSGCFTHTFTSTQNGNLMTSVATTPVSAAATPPNPLSPGPTSLFLPRPPSLPGSGPGGGGGGRLTSSDLPGGPVSETTI